MDRSRVEIRPTKCPRDSPADVYQCDPKENLAEWDDDRFWAEFGSRVNGNGFEPKEGTVIEMWFDRSSTSSNRYAGRATSFAPATPHTPHRPPVPRA